ncbi:hypothetical protein CRE_04720 [Caenorhabditis remanei]|uniref:G-protein coupled receptors family 1 profile domain-containing protein n=1 Tax=Caenorhabditis remanei TaxID=31234 RepID=E3LYW3_CAERE|nr:hypothetical protein CRE_04720 [Caenorhabditis remanei]
MTQQLSSIFSNCSQHYDLEIIFEFCVNATDPCKSIQQIETAVTIAYVDYYSSVTLFSVAGLMNIYCLLVIIPLYRRMQNDSKKKYIFLITRCIAGLLAAISWLLIQCIYLRFIAPTAGNFPYYVMALALNIGSIYGLLGSYVGMAGILYLGVLNPVAYNQHLTLRIVYVAVSIIFLMSIVLAVSENSEIIVSTFQFKIPFAILQAAIAIPVSVKCTPEKCAPLIATMNFVLVFGSLIITIVILLFALISLLRHRKKFKKQDTVSNTNLNSAIRLLTWTLVTVLFVLIAEIIPFVFMEIKKHRGPKPGCYWFYHANIIVEQVSFAMIEAAVWSIALIIDPSANVIFDRNVSKQAKSQVKWMRNLFVGLARTITRRFSPKRGKEEEESVNREPTTQSELIILSHESS